MKKNPKLACVAADIGFEAWKKRPVYTVHCATFKMACELCEINVPMDHGLAKRVKDQDSTGLNTFRALRAYRSEQANALRKRVAQAMREHRAQRFAFA